MFKICTKCKQEKPATQEYFHRNKNRKDGLECICKVCKKEHYKKNKECIVNKTKKYREENKEHCQEVRNKYRQENKEKITEQLKEYYDKTKEQRLEYSKNYYEENKEHILKQAKLFRKENKEILYKQKKKYIEANKEKVAERARQYWYNNKESFSQKGKKYRIKNKEREQERHKRYYMENPHIYRQAGERRRAKAKKLPYTLTIEEWNDIKLYFDNSCAYCGMTEEKHLEKFNEILHQEHFIALSNGGEYTCNNIIPACRSCNSSKNNKDFFEWYPKQEFYSSEREEKIMKFLNYKSNDMQHLSII